jgi:hypothetical protein
LRYVLTTFAYGANLGPAQAARHIRGVSAHELGATAARHFTTEKLNLAGADVVPTCRAAGEGGLEGIDGVAVAAHAVAVARDGRGRWRGGGGVEDGGDDGGVVEDRAPVGDPALGGQDDRAVSE